MQIEEKLSLLYGVPDAEFYKTFNEKKVFISELRPGLEGMRVVSAQMLKKNIEPIVICDNMMAFCMKYGYVKDVHIFYKSVGEKTAICRTGSLIAALCAKKHTVTCFLHKEAKVKAAKRDLKKIGNKSVTVASIKTYAPETEVVPLNLLIRG